MSIVIRNWYLNSMVLLLNYLDNVILCYKVTDVLKHLKLVLIFVKVYLNGDDWLLFLINLGSNELLEEEN